MPPSAFCKQAETEDRWIPGDDRTLHDPGDRRKWRHAVDDQIGAQLERPLKNGVANVLSTTTVPAACARRLIRDVVDQRPGFVGDSSPPAAWPA
jgi:hypothetical protein